jgi:hypothetical protein
MTRANRIGNNGSGSRRRWLARLPGSIAISKSAGRKQTVSDTQKAVEAGRGGFLSEGIREVRRKFARSGLRRTMREQEAQMAAALTDLGQKAWDAKVDLAAFADKRDRLAGLEARAGELSATKGRLEKEKADLEAERRGELEKFAARRKAVEEKKSPVDSALREARSRKTACEQAIRQGESRLAAIAGRLPALDREAAALEAAATADAQQKLAGARAERAKLAAEQGELGPKLAASRAELPAHATEETRLAAESQKHAADIAAIDAEQKATLAHIDEGLRRVQSEAQGTSQQASAVQKDRAGTLHDLGAALYASASRDPALGEPIGRVASVERARAATASLLDASMRETGSMAGGTMAKFWSVTVGVPLLAAALGIGAYQYLHRSRPVAAAVAQPGGPPTKCEVQQPPASGKGLSVRGDCLRQEGTFAGGKLQSGKITYPDGRVREGTYLQGQQIGMGSLAWPDGRRYEGMFVDGRSTGPGVYVDAAGNRFAGMFRPGARLYGIGTRKSPDGSVLVGEFIDGKPSGRMVLVKPDGKAEVVEPPGAEKRPSSGARQAPEAPPAQVAEAHPGVRP